MLGDVNKLFKLLKKKMLTTPSNVWPLHLKQTFPTIILIFIEGEGDGMKSRLLFKIFTTLLISIKKNLHLCYHFQMKLKSWFLLCQQVNTCLFSSCSYACSLLLYWWAWLAHLWLWNSPCKPLRLKVKKFINLGCVLT